MILVILKKIVKKLFGKNTSKNAIYTDPRLTIASSSVLLPGSGIDFRVKSKEEKYICIGEKCIIGAQFIFESELGKITIGNNVHIGGAHLISRNSIQIGNDITMAWGITIYDHNSHSIHWEERRNDNHQAYSDYFAYNGNTIINKEWSNVVSKAILIQDKVWIGFNVTILKGVTIGEGAVIGANSVVTKDIEPWTVVAGNPATVVKQLK